MRSFEMSFSGMRVIVLVLLSLLSGGIAYGAAFVTALSGAQCMDNPGGVHCTAFEQRCDVFIRAPLANPLPDGSYFFVVLEPGTQHTALPDGGLGNLSATAQSDRTLNVVNGVIVSGPTHAIQHDPVTGGVLVQACPFEATSNPGGVFMVAICPADSNEPRSCKFDVFRIAE